MTPTEEIKDRIAARLALEYDQAVARALLKRGVSREVQLGELQRRLLLERSAFTGTETYYLDGAPLVRFRPLQTSHVGGVLTASRPVEYFTIKP
jgi:hypothetical protein